MQEKLEKRNSQQCSFIVLTINLTRADGTEGQQRPICIQTKTETETEIDNISLFTTYPPIFCTFLRPCSYWITSSCMTWWPHTICIEIILFFYFSGHSSYGHSKRLSIHIGWRFWRYIFRFGTFSQGFTPWIQSFCLWKVKYWAFNLILI